MKRIIVILSIITGIFFTGFLVGSTPDETPKKENKNEHYNFYQIHGATLPGKIDFAGEDAPLNNFYVAEGLDKELQVNTYWHSSTLLQLKRANRWFPLIDSILREQEIPTDFKYLALIESGLENVDSPAGASGFWQILKGTAKDHGLEVNKDVDERYNVEKATYVACEYLKDAYERFGSWTLAAVSYNAGKRRIAHTIKNQKADNFYNLYLNEESTRYIYRILAIKTIYENPNRFGFSLEHKDLYQPIPYREIQLTTPIDDLITFAIEQGTTYKMLKTLNPWLVNNKLRNSNHKTYTLRLPQKGISND